MTSPKQMQNCRLMTACLLSLIIVLTLSACASPPIIPPEKTGLLYKAEAQVENRPNSPVFPVEEMPTFYRNEIIFLKSPELLAKAFDKLPTDVQGYLNTESKGDYLSYINENLVIGRLEQTDIFTIAFIDPDPKVCAAVANGIAETYIALIIERLKPNIVRSPLIQELEGKLRRKREEKIKLLSSLGFPGIKDLKNAKTKRWKEILDSISSVENELLELNTKKEHIPGIEDLDEKYLDAATIIAINDSTPLISKLLKEHRSLIYEYDNLKKKYNDKSPAVVGLREKVEANEKALASEVRNYVDSINSRVGFLIRRLTGLNEAKLKLEDEISDLNKKLLKLDNLNLEITDLAKQCAYYRTLVMESGIFQNISLPTVRWVKKATVPDRPFTPSHLSQD